MRVLAIFTCYNRRALTKQSMELLGQNKNVTFDYVIVNDGSTDGTDEMLAAMPKISILPLIISRNWQARDVSMSVTTVSNA